METVKSHLGERLIELRGETPLNVVEKATGVSRANLRRYENGEYIPKEAALTKLAEYYKVSYEELRKLALADQFPEGSKERNILFDWVQEELEDEDL